MIPTANNMLLLERYHYGKSETLGWLHRPGARLVLHTIEGPWREDPGGGQGGLPFVSCVPDGRYRLKVYTSQRHGATWRLVSEDLGVYATKEQVPESGGRYGCILHAGNAVSDVQGCIAPGRRRAASGLDHFVRDSQAAMMDLRNDRIEYDILKIVPVMGARDVRL